MTHPLYGEFKHLVCLFEFPDCCASITSLDAQLYGSTCEVEGTSGEGSYV